MREMRRWGLAACAAVVGVGVSGCPKSPPPGSGGTGGGGGSSAFKIAVIPKGTAHSFWQTVKAGAEAAAAEENAQIIWVGPAKENDITDQINVLQNQANSKVDGIVLAATDSNALVQPVKEIMARGIPVVTIDSGLADKDASLCYIATDNVEGGRQAAHALARLIGEKGKVGLLPFLKGAASSDEREKGFLEAIRQYPGIQVVSTLYTDSDVAKAKDQADNMLTAHPDIVGIFAANEPNGIGAAQALRQRGLAGKVKLVAYDCSEQELEALKEGVIQATVVQDPFRMGYLGVKTVLKAIRKQDIGPKYVDSGMKVVTKENLNDPEVQKLINPPIHR